MRLLIDMQAAQGYSRLRGIGRYTIDIVRALIAVRGEHTILLLLNADWPVEAEEIRSEFGPVIGFENVFCWYPGAAFSIKNEKDSWKVKIAEKIRECAIIAHQPDVVFIPSMFEGFDDNLICSLGETPYSVPTFTTLHDLIPLIWSESYLSPNPIYEAFYFKRLGYLEKSNYLFAISESAASEAVKHISYPEDRMFVTHEGVKGCFKQIDWSESKLSSFLKRFNINKSFILYSGAADPRKNHFRLMQAFSNLSMELKRKYQLVFAGNISTDYKKLIEEYAQILDIGKDSLIVTGLITDDDLNILYNACDVFVFPSWHEGFGLPVLEAMTCGAPVIGANTSSIPEIINNNQALFDPFNVQSISEALSRVLTDKPWRDDLKRHSLKRCRDFSWDKAARLMVSKFEEAVTLPQYHKDTIDIRNYLIDEFNHSFPEQRNKDSILSYAKAITKSVPVRKQSRLYLDISELCQRDAKTGVQRVVRGLLKELLTIHVPGYEVRPVYAEYNKHTYKFANRFTANFMSEIGEFKFSDDFDDFIDIIPGDIFFGLDLQHDVVIQNSDIYRSMRLSGARVYFLMHDLLPVLFPQFFHENMYRVHTEWLQELSRNDGVVCVSQSVAEEYIEWLNHFAWTKKGTIRIGWSHNAYDINGTLPTKGLPDDAQDKLIRLAQRPTFLMVGTVEPRKGYMQILRAFEVLWQSGQDINLAIVGKQGWDVDLLVELIRNHEELGKRLFWFKGVSDEYLEYIYKESDCLIAASLGEGFGLPLIEAAAHDLPIIARDIPVFREVAGNSAVYFTGLHPSDAAICVKRWLTLKRVGAISDVSKIERISWRESAENLLKNIIGDQWFYVWSPPNKMYFSAGDQKLLMETGVQEGLKRRTNGGRGYILYGQYVSIKPGDYRVVVYGEVRQGFVGGAFSDASAKRGTNIIAHEPMKADGKDNIICDYIINIDQFYDDFEARVWVDEYSNIFIFGIEIEEILSDSKSITSNPTNKEMVLF